MMKLKLEREQKEALVERVQSFFELERDESIGTIAAEQLLDYMLAELGPYVYNQAITDARKTVTERLQSVEDELYALEQSVSVKRTRGR
ncbi:DUF2164 domain-containing protein [Paenibacillus radicis (ex Gao et al. 2016)]|uniref:DUF2164 domain-containing protein n=1 Tax=Paenibacillus radicis (ex Gao et al. 2016) TaxID=1737354 RepID=A0A917HRD2_9BACL|nr:DUF2164 domain-containing protein [Paenibacillus radicis (ex Gao et al. 2016)]GGG86668.1 hypothetical protein GCM10010918_51080 [Paenibacillus radicis (ex Gao et al. 2016)]